MGTARPDHGRPDDVKQRVYLEKRDEITKRVVAYRLDDVVLERLADLDFETVTLLDLARSRPAVERRPKVDGRGLDLVTLENLAYLAQHRRLRGVHHLKAEERRIFEYHRVKRDARRLLAMVERRPFERSNPCRGIDRIAAPGRFLPMPRNGNAEMPVLMIKDALKRQKIVLGQGFKHTGEIPQIAFSNPRVACFVVKGEGLPGGRLLPLHQRHSFKLQPRRQQVAQNLPVRRNDVLRNLPRISPRHLVEKICQSKTLLFVTNERFQIVKHTPSVCIETICLYRFPI